MDYNRLQRDFDFNQNYNSDFMNVFYNKGKFCKSCKTINLKNIFLDIKVRFDPSETDLKYFNKAFDETIKVKFTQLPERQFLPNTFDSFPSFTPSQGPAYEPDFDVPPLKDQEDPSGATILPIVFVIVLIGIVILCCCKKLFCEVKRTPPTTSQHNNAIELTSVAANADTRQIPLHIVTAYGRRSNSGISPEPSAPQCFLDSPHSSHSNSSTAPPDFHFLPPTYEEVNITRRN